MRHGFAPIAAVLLARNHNFMAVQNKTVLAGLAKGTVAATSISTMAVSTDMAES